MASCPKCNANIEEDFGLVDCSVCGVAVLIGIDGEAQVASQDEVPPSIPKEEVSIHQPDIFTGTAFRDVSELDDEATNFNFAGLEQEGDSPAETTKDNIAVESSEQESDIDDIFPSFDEADESKVVTSFEGFKQNRQKSIVDEFTSFETPVNNEQDEIIEEPSLQSVENEEVFEDLVDEFNDEKTNFLAESEIMKAKDHPAQTGLADLTDFANSKRSSLKDGTLKYKLFIGGIDTAQIKKLVFEEISDKKLLLDVSELNKQIVDGCLCIEPLSAVKASVIINRLKSVPVTLTWDQYDVRKA